MIYRFLNAVSLDMLEADAFSVSFTTIEVFSIFLEWRE
jgi:hypothetical protein